MAFSIGKFHSPSKRNLETQSDFQFRNKVLLQNRALAKKNSTLMTKIAELESRISELIQQNIELRDQQAKSEDNKRKWFEEKLNIIEEGVSQRFEEMFQMFSTIRSNEGLPSSNISLNNLLGNISSNDNSTDKTVTFQGIKSPRTTQSSINERRRKSARRQSIYIPSQPNSPEKLEEKISQDQVIEKSEDETRPMSIDDEDRALEANQTQAIKDLNDYQESTQEILNEQEELSHASSFSPIKISSPNTQEVRKRDKFKVYEDFDNEDLLFHEEFEKSITRLTSKVYNTTGESKLEKEKINEPSENIKDKQEVEEQTIEDELSDIQSPLDHDSAKVKHTNSKKSKSKASFDEQFPVSIDSMDTIRKTRTRGKHVSYTEPSLRQKMRRSSKKFVDAVGHRDSFYIYNGPKEENMTLEIPTTAGNTIDISSNAEIDEQNRKYILSEDNQQIHSPVKEKPKPLIEQDNVNITKRRKPLGTLNKNKLQKIESDVKGTKKSSIDDSEMSVFDLVEESAVGIPKTYKNQPNISTKRKSSGGNRRHSMLL
ncbi:hypothetical protein WICMUC_002979 [Wickerhamomyces mucosus]|uniref:Shugoshin N-terminal coiled-coil domain-containing protein n=1 Tax=Wickerhamomyces mucosus TaxID=1378264 RepID=A0A9P8PMT0_9ASCO|nr:hypothetical protein WICMUC_002979 [Wickerhamomyces mucosus]